MPTQGITLAKNRIQVVQQKLIDGMIGDVSPDSPDGKTIIYYGRTADNVATELFIAGKGGASSEGTTYYNRLYLPESTAIFFEVTYLTYNATDDTFPYVERGFGFVQNLNGTTAAVFDLNKSAGNDAYVTFDIVANGGASGIDLAVGTQATLTIAVDDTGDFLKVSVTGTAAKTIYHKVYMEVYSINETECRSGLFFGDTAAQSRGV